MLTQSDSLSGPNLSNSRQNEPRNNAGNKRSRYLLLTALIVILLGGTFTAIALLVGHNTKKASPKFKVGVMMPFSGGSSSMGYGALKGILLAQKELNANNIEIIQMDSKCDPKAAVSAFTQLIEQGVVVVIGDGCSSSTLAVLATANSSKIVIISPSAADSSLSIPDDYFFRMVPPNTFQASFLAQVMYDRGIRQVAVFYTNQQNIRGFNSDFKSKYEAVGGKVVASVSAEPEIIDLKKEAQLLLSANPQAILIAPSSAVSATAIIKYIREEANRIQLFGIDRMYDSNIIENSGLASEDMIISSYPVGNNSFQQALVNEYQQTEQLYAAPQAYDIIKILQLAVESGATTGERIKQILPTIEIDGKSGHVAFNQNGDVEGKDYRYDLFKIKNGSFVYIENE